MRKSQNKVEHLPAVIGDAQADARLAAMDQKQWEEARGVINAAREVISATGAVVEKYRMLVRVVREASLGPAVVTDLLCGLGFAKSRVSEINRIAAAPESVFLEYQAGALGFKGALEIVRQGSVTGVAGHLFPELQDTKAGPVDGLTGSAHEMVVAAEQSAAVPGKGKGKPAKPSKRAEKHVQGLVRLAVAGKVKAQKWTVGEWVVTLAKA